MDVCSPANQGLTIGLTPKTPNKRPQQELLRQTHLRVRGHFEPTHLQQAQAPGAAIGRIEFIDTKLGPMGIARRVHQQMAEQPVHQPRGHLAGTGQVSERNFQLVKRIVTSLVNARALAGRPDEQTAE